MPLPGDDCKYSWAGHTGPRWRPHGLPDAASAYQTACVYGKAHLCAATWPSNIQRTVAANMSDRKLTFLAEISWWWALICPVFSLTGAAFLCWIIQWVSWRCCCFGLPFFFPAPITPISILMTPQLPNHPNNPGQKTPNKPELHRNRKLALDRLQKFRCYPTFTQRLYYLIWKNKFIQYKSIFNEIMFVYKLEN